MVGEIGSSERADASMIALDMHRRSRETPQDAWYWVAGSMWTKVKAFFGGGAQGGQPVTVAATAVEYKGYRILPAPYKNNGQYQTAGSIEKDAADGVKVHNFIRADTYASADDAVAFTISKAKQIIDQQGDRIFT